MHEQKTAEGRTSGGTSWRIHYEITGQGPDLLLLHGAGPGATGQGNFRRNLDALSERFTCWVIDFPGFGKSSKNLDVFPGAGPFRKAGNAVLAFMDAVGLHRTHVFGTSLGAAAALCAAMEQSERFGRMVLVAPGGGSSGATTGPTEAVRQLFGYYAGEGPSLEKMRRFLQGLVFDPSQLPASLIEERFASSTDPEIVANPPLPPTGASLAPELLISLDPRMAEMRVPTLLVWGLQDQCNPVDGMESFKSIPTADYYLLAHCGHWPHWEHPTKVSAITADFIGRD